MLDYLFINWERAFEILWLPVCIQLAALLIGLLLNHLINTRIHSKLDTGRDTLPGILVNALKGVPVSWCSGVGLYWTITALNITPRLQTLLSNILLAVIFFTLARVISNIAVGFIDMHTAKSEGSGAKTSLLTSIVQVSVYILSGLILLQSYGISITPIITALGVGGMAVALGLQEVMANIFAGLHLILSGQIRLGDYIRLSTGEEGCVTDIAFRFTTIQSVTNNVIVVPNQKISSAILTNYNMPQQEISIVIPVGVSYDSDLEKVERVTLEVARQVMQKIDNSLTAYEPAVRFHTFGESSIDFNVILHSSQFTNQFPLKHEFIKALTARYRKEGIEIPYPVRTIYKSDKS